MSSQAPAPDSPVDPRWDRMGDVFDRAVKLPRAERESFVRAELYDDPDLQEEVLQLIEHDVGSRTSPLTNAVGAAIDATSRDRRHKIIGKSIGPYRIAGVLGHGGTGNVYLGERADQQYSGKVAIKIVDSAAVHPDLSMRFRAERQILANLNHPNIARLIDAGETEDSRPYLVMEYVQGLTIDAYCDGARLTLEERLKLFLDVCAAVQYAHQNLVVHRDLKPANILVTGDGTPKLLDFGIAKLLDSANAGAALALTRMNDRLLTPEYAAPEQIRGEPVTTASDVYALGTVLYELLTGFRPFVVPADSSQIELERLVCITDPLRPSSAITRGLAGAPGQGQPKVVDVALARDLSPDRLVRGLRGDLDAICMRALRKEPQHRYATVEQLADDVRRFLAREPVVARQGTWIYYSQRFIRRHAFAVGSAVLFVVLVIAFAVTMSLQAQRIAAERDRATLERARAETVSDFMLDVFGAADPFEHRGREITARELLDEAATRIGGDLDKQPDVRARLMEAIGVAYRRQGQFDRAVTLLEQALQLRRTLPGQDKQQLAELLRQLAVAQREQGLFEDSEKNLREALLLTGQQLSSTRGEAVVDLARLQHRRGNWREAQSGYEEALDLFRRLQGDHRRSIAEVLISLTSLHAWKAEYEAAEQAARQAIQIYESTEELQHPSRVLAEFQLAEVLTATGRIAEASIILERVLASRRLLYGDGSSEVADCLEALSRIRLRQGKIADAEQLARQAVDAQQQALGADHFMTAYQRTSLGLVLMRRGALREAEAEVRRALEIYGQTLQPDHQYVAAAQHALGEILIARRDFAAAETTLREAQARWERDGAPAWRVARTTSALGEAVFRLGRTNEAEDLLLRSYRAVAADRAASEEARRRTRERIESFYREVGTPEKIQRLPPRAD